jgi:hypothetical protein
VKNLLMFIILCAVAWFGYGKYQSMNAPADDAASFTSPLSTPAPAQEQFSCDGRTHCSQMRSCAEATYFLKHCPNTRMDGDNDGVPCEQQWCN